MQCPSCKANWPEGVTICETCGVEMTAPRSGKPSGNQRSSSPPASVRNRVFGAIGFAWGAAILFRAIQSGLPPLDTSAGAGAILGVVFGVALLVAGLYYLIRG